MDFMTGVNLLLGLNSMTIQILFAILTVVIAFLFSAGDSGAGGKGYLKSLIMFPFLNLMCVIVFTLWGIDYTLTGIMFWVGIVLMVLGIYISRNNEQILS